MGFNCKIVLLLGLTWLSSFCIAGDLYGQTPTQTVRGTVVDGESQFPLPAVKAYIPMGEGKVIGILTDDNGEFKLENVPVGRQTVEFRFLGYQPMTLSNVEVTSAKEVVLSVELLSSSVDMDVVEISGRKSGDVGNEHATVSAREFSVVETGLYAGSRGEPARMAANYAGVQGADDSRNDIIVRGNSPSGVLWKLDGINIPNPNHFVIPGTGGGSVTLLNNKFLSNSDFFTGAFPAEYGNGVAAAFDLKMRNGNDSRHEFSGQLGLLGTELMAEGPLSKEGKASYLGMYRYSTLQLFGFLGVNIGTDAIPQYQDGAFRINIPLKNGANLAFWGMGGKSRVDLIFSTEEAPNEDGNLYGESDRDQYFASNTGIAGLTYLHPINVNTFVKAGVAVSTQSVIANHDYIVRHIVQDRFVVDSLPPILDYTFRENKYSTYLHFNKKLGRNQTIKAGFNFDLFDMYYLDSNRTVIPATDSTSLSLSSWRRRWDTTAIAPLIQPFIQYKLRAKDKLTFTAGITSNYWGLNKNSFSPIEPRLGLSYQIRKKSKLNFGAGLHSQTQSPYLYFYGPTAPNGNPQEHNTQMGLTKSIHNILGYDWQFAPAFRLKAETYFQYLYHIPVEIRESPFSLINAGSGFNRFFPDSLVNEGVGRNYGLELTLEKFFTKGYYFLVTGSVFDAKYQGSDKVWRNTTFNGRYAFNGLFAKEFNLGVRHVIQLGGKLTYIGGRWYGPADTVASARELEVIYQDEGFNTIQFRPYFRADVKILYRWNHPNVTTEFGLDLINVSGQQNILTLSYVPDHPSGNPIQEEYQLGFLPIFYLRFDWNVGRREQQ